MLRSNPPTEKYSTHWKICAIRHLFEDNLAFFGSEKANFLLFRYTPRSSGWGGVMISWKYVWTSCRIARMDQNKSFFEQLYDAHVTDLRSVTDIVPTVGNEFICPVCLVNFTTEDIANKRLSDGHVWPTFIRDKSGSQLAKTHHVILCDRCNWEAGAHGDAHVQLLEKVRDGTKTGKHYGDQLIQITSGSTDRPITLRGNIARTDKLAVTLAFPIDKKSRRWARNDPKEQARFEALRDSGEPISMVVHPHHGVKAHLAKAGWITSAYLFAFYTLGYRYIFHESLNDVRQYIARSFEDEAKQELALPQSDVFRVEITDDNVKDPQIGVMLPFGGNKPVYLQINFFDYQVRLPFRVSSEILSDVIHTLIPNSDELVSQALATGNPLYSELTCTKTHPHDCTWDYILGKPLPDEP